MHISIYIPKHYRKIDIYTLSNTVTLLGKRLRKMNDIQKFLQCINLRCGRTINNKLR